MLSYYYQNQYVDYNHAILTITHKEEDQLTIIGIQKQINGVKLLCLDFSTLMNQKTLVQLNKSKDNNQTKFDAIQDIKDMTKIVTEKYKDKGMNYN